MKRNNSIQLKAVLLLTVFGFNTVVGFACAIGLDMSFNSTYHHSVETAAVHVHKDGKKHDHKKPTHHHEANKQKEKKEGCCNDSVIKFSLTDKAAPQSIVIISPVFFTAIIATYHAIEIVYHSQITGSSKYFARNYHPPIPDIRVAIRSFQI